MPFVQLSNGTNVFYESKGLASGPPIIFIHGLGLSLVAWQPLLEHTRLAATHRLIAYDFRGSGLTPSQATPQTFQSHVEDLTLLIEALKLDKAPILVGHSMGSLIASAYAVQNENNVSKLGLLASTVTPLAEAVRTMQRDMARSVREQQSLVSTAEQLASLLVADPAKNLFARSIVRGMILALAPEEYARNTEALAGIDEHIQVETLRLPVLVVGGDSDTLGGDTSDVAALIKDAKHEVLKGVGHTLALEDPEGVADLLEKFVYE